MSFPIYANTILIRPVTPDDQAAILDVYHQCEDFLALGPQPHASLDMVTADLALSRQEEGIFCAIFEDSSLDMIGVVDYVPKGFEGCPATAFLSLLMIAAPYRRRGLGAEIVSLVEKEIWQDPTVTAIHSGVQVNNPQAQRFWQNHGYVVTGPPQLLPDQTVAVPLQKLRPHE